MTTAIEITSRRNERVRRLKELGASARFRREQGEFLCDGLKLLEEAVKWNARIGDVLTTGDLPLELPPSARVYRVTEEVLEAASPLRAPQGVLFSAAIPPAERPESLAGAVIVENLQDPGNLGTVLRTANAFGIRRVVLTGSCADLYNPKAVRASMGAVFRQSVSELTLAELRPLAEKTPVYGAALHREAADVRTLDLAEAAVAIGNEGAGLSEALLALCAGAVFIPMDPRCESLNAAAAAAVLMWEMGKNRL